MSTTLSTASSPGVSSSWLRQSPAFPSTLWRIVLRAPNGEEVTLECRATAQDQAVLVALRTRPGHVLAKDEHGVPLVTRRPTPVA